MGSLAMCGLFGAVWVVWSCVGFFSRCVGGLAMCRLFGAVWVVWSCVGCLDLCG